MSDNSIISSLARRDVLVAGASVLVLAGCGNLIEPSNAAQQIYVLAPNFPAARGGTNLPWQLSITQPEASASLSTQRIALIRGQAMDYFANAQWTDGAPQLVQNLLVEAFEKGGATGAVAKDVDGIHANYILQSALRGFEAHYDHGDAAPTVVVDLSVKFLTASRGEIVGSKEFRQEVQAGANSVAAVVAAFDQAVSALLNDIVPWIVTTANEIQRGEADRMSHKR